MNTDNDDYLADIVDSERWCHVWHPIVKTLREAKEEVRSYMRLHYPEVKYKIECAPNAQCVHVIFSKYAILEQRVDAFSKAAAELREYITGHAVNNDSVVIIAQTLHMLTEELKSQGYDEERLAICEEVFRECRRAKQVRDRKLSKR